MMEKYIIQKYYCNDCKEKLGETHRKRLKEDGNKLEMKEYINYNDRTSFPDWFDCKCDRIYYDE